VFGLDIDGTLVNYHRHFTQFANLYFGIEVDPDSYTSVVPFYKHLGVSKANYRKCKLAYRRGELKRSVPALPAPYPDARRLTKMLRDWGCDIWLCTTRPYLSHDVVDDATRHNLRRIGVVYQGLIWGERKYHELVRTVGKERIVGVLDDLPEMCDQAMRLGLRPAFAYRAHNAVQYGSINGPGGAMYPAVETEEETLTLLKSWLNEWRMK
jgi:hypothetical protein